MAADVSSALGSRSVVLLSEQDRGEQTTHSEASVGENSKVYVLMTAPRRQGPHTRKTSCVVSALTTTSYNTVLAGITKS